MGKTGALVTEAYWRDGFLVQRAVLSESILLPIQQVIERYVDSHLRDLHAAGRVADLHEAEPFGRRLAAAYEGTDLTVRKWHSFLFCRELYALARHPGILSTLEAILGPEITFHGDFQLMPKLPGSEVAAFPWHQDTQYYGVPSRDMHVVTVWIPLVDVNEENGCLLVMPGSHRWGLLEGIRGPDLNIRPLEDIEKRGTPLAMPMRRGDVLFLTNLTFHASRTNRMRTLRWSLDFGYSATPGSRTLTAGEQASYDFLYGWLPQVGRTPLVVRSADPAREETWDAWLAKRTHQLRRIAGRRALPALANL